MLSKNKLFIFFWINFLIWIFINNLFFSFVYSFSIIVIYIILIYVFYLKYKKYLYYLLSIIVWFSLWVVFSYVNLYFINIKENYISSLDDWNKHIVLLELKWIYKTTNVSKDYITKVLKIDNEIINNNINFLIKVPYSVNLSKGTLLEQNLKIKKIKNNYSWFNFKKYLELKNIYGVYEIYEINNVWKVQLNYLLDLINNFRNKFLSIISKIYPRDEALFLWWILIWARENLPEKLSTSFNNSWLTHLIAVSWYNITIIIVFISYLLKNIPVFIRTIVITVSIIFFTLLVWDNSAVLRASIMWMLWYYILISWRSWNAFSLLLLTAFIMTLFNPLYLNYDISFQLSFLAVLWLLYTWDFFKKIFNFLPEKFAIQESFVLTLSAFVFTLPIMVFNFWQIVLLSPISNMLVWWAIPFAMLFWFISILWYLILPIIWIIIWWITYLFLRYVIEMVYFFWWLETTILKINFWELSLYIEVLYFMVIIFLILYNKKENKS